MKLLPAPARWTTVPPTIEATLTVASPELGAALVSRALRSLERGEVTPTCGCSALSPRRSQAIPRWGWMR